MSYKGYDGCGRIEHFDVSGNHEKKNIEKPKISNLNACFNGATEENLRGTRLFHQTRKVKINFEE